MAEQHQAQEQHEQTAEELHELKRIRREKLAELQAAGNDPFQQVRFERDHYTSDIHEHFDELEGKTVRLAGRMMSKRIMGKASFSDMTDRYGRLQLYIKRDNVGEDVYKGYKKFDIGDIIGVSGYAFKTKTGRDLGRCHRADPALQEPQSAAREVARPEGHRYALSSALR